MQCKLGNGFQITIFCTLIKVFIQKELELELRLTAAQLTTETRGRFDYWSD
jgi:hypothetical protein